MNITVEVCSCLNLHVDFYVVIFGSECTGWIIYNCLIRKNISTGLNSVIIYTLLLYLKVF